MADTVQRIGYSAFLWCKKLVFVRLSRNLEYIGGGAFQSCTSLKSIYILPSCTDIGNQVFFGCKELIILNVPNDTRLGTWVISETALVEESYFEEYKLDSFGDYENNEEVNALIKNVNQGEEYALHRACSSFNPLPEIISEIVKRDGLQCFKKQNEIGITPSQYLHANPFAEVEQIAIAKRYVLEMMGEIL